MRVVGEGVVTSEVTGYLRLTEDQLERLIIREPIADYYDVENTPFARGKFAAVRRARCRTTGRCFAAKVMRKRRRAQDVRHEIIHEAAILVLAKDFSTIVQLHQIYESSSEIILLLELATGGELQRVVDEEECLEETSVRQYVRHVLNALKFLHHLNIAHLDIKPQNVLLTDQHPHCEVRLCDFGISRIILGDIEVREVLGTPDYVAPEILQYEPICLATDMWSVGVLTYVLLSGHSPFGGDTKQETFLNISQGNVDFPDDLFSKVSSEACDFISRLLVIDPSERLTVDQALRHPWLSGCIASPPSVSSMFCTSVVACLSPRCPPSPDPLILNSSKTIIDSESNSFVSKLEINPPITVATAEVKVETKKPSRNSICKATKSSIRKSIAGPDRKYNSESQVDGRSPASPGTPKTSRVSRKSTEPSRIINSSSPSQFTRSKVSAKRGTDSSDSSPNSTSVTPKSRAVKRLAESLERNADSQSRISPISPKPRTVINKENNRNIINSHRRELTGCQKSASSKSLTFPSPSFHRRTKLEAPPGSTSAKREEYMKKAGLSKSADSQGSKRTADKSKNNVKLSPMCLRREGGKCELISKNETNLSQREYKSFILEKGVC